MALQYKVVVYDQYRGCCINSFEDCLLIGHHLYINLYRGRRMQPGNLRVVENLSFFFKHIYYDKFEQFNLVLVVVVYSWSGRLPDLLPNIHNYFLTNCKLFSKHPLYWNQCLSTSSLQFQASAVSKFFLLINYI